MPNPSQILMPNFASKSPMRSTGSFSAPVTTILSGRSCSGFALRRNERRNVGVLMSSSARYFSIISASFGVSSGRG